MLSSGADRVFSFLSDPCEGFLQSLPVTRRVLQLECTIDLLDTLESRTKGNLEEVEETMLRGIVSELKMLFVRAPERQKEIETEMKRQEALKETFTSPKTAPSDTLIDDEEE